MTREYEPEVWEIDHDINQYISTDWDGVDMYDIYETSYRILELAKKRSNCKATEYLVQLLEYYVQELEGGNIRVIMYHYGGLVYCMDDEPVSVRRLMGLLNTITRISESGSNKIKLGLDGYDAIIDLRHIKFVKYDDGCGGTTISANLIGESTWHKKTIKMSFIGTDVE